MTDRLSDAALDAAGLDTAAGIERLGGDSQLYLSLLYKFKTEHRDDMRNLQECREKNDYDAVYKMVHTLQSVTGNIAAREVSEQMHIILKAMKEKVPLQSVGKDLDRVSADFNALLTAIDRLPDSVFKDFSRPEGSMRTGRRDELMASLLDLSRYIEFQQPGECQSILKDLLSCSWSEEIRAKLMSLASFLDSFNFTDSRDLVLDLLDSPAD